MHKHILCYMLVTLIIIMTGCGANTPAQVTSETEDKSIQRDVIRIDKDGFLYYMNYTKDYYSTEMMNTLRDGGFIDTGCSSFFTYNLSGEPITCRNYDYMHRISKEDTTPTGLNIVLHCNPEGKYESISLADAIWCDENNPLLRDGGPDMAGFDPAMIDVIPYECMDGINEKGLCVSVLRVDIKEGDQNGRYPIAASMLLRFMLDDCADVDEAIKKVDTAIVMPEDWQTCHLYVTDAAGNYAVIESRNGEVSVINSDVVTNFYLAYDDIEDSYRNGVLRESAVMITDENGGKQYNFGYGHGYHRFVTIASQLESHKDTSFEEYRTKMSESSALVVLQSAAQNPETTAAGTSMTQYSAIYNNEKRSLEVWPFQDYSTSYAFDVNGNRLH